MKRALVELSADDLAMLEYGIGPEHPITTRVRDAIEEVGTDVQDLTPDEVATIVADLMPIGGGGRIGAALRLYARAIERSARQIAVTRTEL